MILTNYTNAFFKFNKGISENINPTLGLNTPTYLWETVILTVYSVWTWLEINDISKTRYMIMQQLLEISSGNSLIEKPITYEEIITGLIMWIDLPFLLSNVE